MYVNKTNKTILPYGTCTLCLGAMSKVSASEREDAAVKRQQAFEAWLERKQEEQRVSLVRLHELV